MSIAAAGHTFGTVTCGTFEQHLRRGGTIATALHHRGGGNMGKTGIAVIVGVTSGLITAGVMFVINRVTRWRDWRREQIPDIEQHEPQHWTSSNGQRSPTYQVTLWPRQNVDFVVRSLTVKRPRRMPFEVRSAHAGRPALNQWRKQAGGHALEDCRLRARDNSPLTIGVSFPNYEEHGQVEIQLRVLQQPRMARESTQTIKIAYRK